MDDTWRKANGTKIADDGTLVRLAIETIDGRQMTVDMVPEMIPQLAAELRNAKFHAELLAAGPAEDEGPLQPTNIRRPIDAKQLIRTNYVERGRSLIQIELAGGGVFEFLVPLKSGYDHTVE
ncbi:hypothetical protein LCGC14_0638520 [marine sediment metagenome]|uniref:Uncharacterized protein n=1 Tax=marine sediment metagenome TaxID=412755 RepID=A0A0F9QZV8_9ZZZZ